MLHVVTIRLAFSENGSIRVMKAETSSFCFNVDPFHFLTDLTDCTKKLPVVLIQTCRLCFTVIIIVINNAFFSTEMFAHLLPGMLRNAL